jgi:alcohol dehydrogenase class IV
MQIFVTPDVESVAFGSNALDSLADRLALVGASRVLVVMSQSLAKVGVQQRIHSLLGERVVGVWTATPQHVPRTAVLEAARLARTARADSLVSVGGGTHIDCAKAVALCVAAGIDSPAGFETYRAHRSPHPVTTSPELEATMPHVAIPTTLSGAEHTDLAGVTDGATGAKHIYRYRGLAPKAVILDPTVAQFTPPTLWAASGIRALDHAVESMLATGSMTIVDSLATTAIQLLQSNLVRSVTDPEDLETRLNCLLAAWLSIYGITNTGAGLSHAIGHQLATRFGFLHGIASAIMLPHVMEFNAPYTQTKLAKVAAAFARTDGSTTAAPDAVRELIDRLCLPTTISEAGGDASQFAAMATEVVDDISVATNPRPVSQADIVELLQAAW